MSKVDLEIADEKLRKLVKEYKTTGLPEEIPAEEGLKKLSEKQEELLFSIKDMAEKEKEFESPEDCKPGSEHWKLRLKIRKELQKAVKANLIFLGIIKRNAIIYGAIPDPEQNFRYYRLPDMNYACWDCGDEILVKNQTVSIHDAPFALSGSGKTKRRAVPYCPSCEREPAASTVA